MAKKSTNKKSNTTVVSLYNNGYIYFTKKDVKKSKLNNKPKISLKKYNPKTRTHQLFIEGAKKIKSGKR